MEFVREDDLYNWRTKDAAGLYVAHSSESSRPPLELSCTVIGHSGIVRPETVTVETANLEFLGAGLFGRPRDKSEHHAGWTGDAYKFGVYAHQCRHKRHDVVLLRTDGGGFYSYIDVSLTAAEMWRHLCGTCSPEMLWNICSCVVHTHDLARGKGRQEIMNVFAEGRLKKRRRQGRVQVYVQTKIMPIRPAPEAAQKKEVR